MNATSSGVAFSAAKIRSPRSAVLVIDDDDSLTAAISATARSTVSNPSSLPPVPVPLLIGAQANQRRAQDYCPVHRAADSPPGVTPSRSAVAALDPGLRFRVGGQQPFDIFGDHVHLEVDDGAHRRTPSVVKARVVGISDTSNQSAPSPETVSEMPSTVIDPSPRHSGPAPRAARSGPPPSARRGAGDHRPAPVDVALHDVAAETAVERRGALEFTGLPTATAARLERFRSRPSHRR